MKLLVDNLQTVIQIDIGRSVVSPFLSNGHSLFHFFFQFEHSYLRLDVDILEKKALYVLTMGNIEKLKLK